MIQGRRVRFPQMALCRCGLYLGTHAATRAIGVYAENGLRPNTLSADTSCAIGAESVCAPIGRSIGGPFVAGMAEGTCAETLYQAAASAIVLVHRAAGFDMDLVMSINEDLSDYESQVASDADFKAFARRLLMSLIGISNPDNARFRMFANRKLRRYLTPEGLN